MSAKGIQIKYLSFVNQTSALNVSTTREELPSQIKDQLITKGFYLKSKSSQVKVKSNEEMIFVLLAGHLEDFSKAK